MGEHGESQMIPWSKVAIAGKPLDTVLRDNPDRLPDFDKDAICNTIADITYNLAHVKEGTTWGIAAVTAEIIQAILGDESRVIPVSAMLHGEYGLEDVYVGVPAVMGAQGVQELVEYHLTDEEEAQFKASAEELQKYMTEL